MKIMIVKMKTDCDCMVACLAMLLKWSYKRTADYFPPKAVRETGYRFKWLIPYLRANNIYLNWFDFENNKSDWSKPDWSKPAIVDVPSLNAPDKGDHIIYWDGEKVIDPSRKGLKYDKIPDVVNNVYQINERWTKNNK